MLNKRLEILKPFLIFVNFALDNVFDSSKYKHIFICRVFQIIEYLYFCKDVKVLVIAHFFLCKQLDLCRNLDVMYSSLIKLVCNIYMHHPEKRCENINYMHLDAVIKWICILEKCGKKKLTSFAKTCGNSRNLRL